MMVPGVIFWLVVPGLLRSWEGQAKNLRQLQDYDHSEAEESDSLPDELLYVSTVAANGDIIEGTKVFGQYIG